MFIIKYISQKIKNDDDDDDNDNETVSRAFKGRETGTSSAHI